MTITLFKNVKQKRNESVWFNMIHPTDFHTLWLHEDPKVVDPETHQLLGLELEPLIEIRKDPETVEDEEERAEIESDMRENSYRRWRNREKECDHAKKVGAKPIRVKMFRMGSDKGQKVAKKIDGSNDVDKKKKNINKTEWEKTLEDARVCAFHLIDQFENVLDSEGNPLDAKVPEDVNLLLDSDDSVSLMLAGFTIQAHDFFLKPSND